MEPNRLISGEGVAYACLVDDGVFSNNENFPLLKYNSPVELDDSDPAATFERLFEDHGWTSSWRNGVYAVHHYHSSAHEVLGVYSGSAIIQLGGEEGVTVETSAGDVVVIPAGVAHKRVQSTGSFAVVGAYPDGQMWDMCYGRDGERPGTDRNIAGVSVPRKDPVFGESGPLLRLWKPG